MVSCVAPGAQAAAWSCWQGNRIWRQASILGLIRKQSSTSFICSRDLPKALTVFQGAERQRGEWVLNAAC
jgi:hypothetical protein